MPNSVYAQESGSNIGCRQFTLTNGHSYTVTLQAWAKVNGNFLKVWPDSCPASGYPTTCDLPKVDDEAEMPNFRNTDWNLLGPDGASTVSDAPDENHLEWCDGQSRDDVSLETDNRATQIDYTRFLWEMYADGMDMGEFLEIVANADPATWDWNNDGYSSDNPRVRMRNAAETNFPEWLEVATRHGVHR